MDVHTSTHTQGHTCKDTHIDTYIIDGQIHTHDIDLCHIYLTSVPGPKSYFHAPKRMFENLMYTRELSSSHSQAPVGSTALNIMMTAAALLLDE